MEKFTEDLMTWRKNIAFLTPTTDYNDYMLTKEIIDYVLGKPLLVEKLLNDGYDTWEIISSIIDQFKNKLYDDFHRKIIMKNMIINFFFLE